MKIELTKDIFEMCVPAARMPERNSSVFNRLSQQFEDAYAALIRAIVGPQYESLIDSDEVLRPLSLRIVCIGAFMRTARSLDVVLTATGFGIVSTESTAPASKLRVDSLLEELGVQELDLIDQAVTHLTHVDGWGLTEQALRCIPTLFYRPQQLQTLTTLPLTTANWQTAQGRAVTASALLRRDISDEYMDELLQKLRTATLTNADAIVVQKCLAFMADFISSYDQTNGHPNDLLLRQIVHQIETYSDSYPTYTSSTLYARRHAQRYQNKKSDPTFFFM